MNFADYPERLGDPLDINAPAIAEVAQSLFESTLDDPKHLKLDLGEGHFMNVVVTGVEARYQDAPQRAAGDWPVRFYQRPDYLIRGWALGTTNGRVPIVISLELELRTSPRGDGGDLIVRMV